MLKILNVDFFNKNNFCDGGVCIQWGKVHVGFGEILLYKYEDKLYASSEYMGKDFIKECLLEMVEQINIID